LGSAVAVAQRERERERERVCVLSVLQRERKKACREKEHFLLLNNRVGSEQLFPMHWEELFTSQGMEKGREAAVV
jgi:hypothetical protein